MPKLTARGVNHYEYYSLFYGLPGHGQTLDLMVDKTTPTSTAALFSPSFRFSERPAARARAPVADGHRPPVQLTAAAAGGLPRAKGKKEREYKKTIEKVFLRNYENSARYN